MMAELKMKGLNGVTYTGILKLMMEELNKEGIVLLSKDIDDDGDGKLIEMVVVNSIYPEQYKSRIYELPSEEPDHAKRPMLVIDIIGKLDTITIKYNIVVNTALNNLGFKLESNEDGVVAIDHNIEMITEFVTN